MKTLLITFLLLSQTVSASHAHNDVSIHGMFVFGRSTIYLNHLPMFMPKHDQQAIFEATFDERGSEAYAKAGAFVTLVPEPMSLLELIHAPHDFYADLYDGHFERGGTKIAAHVLVHVVTVVHAHRIGAASPQADIEVGECRAHFITKAPDFDEITCGEVKIYREDTDLQ